MEGVPIAEAREVVVAWVGVAALAVVEASGEAVVVVAGQSLNAVLVKEREDEVRIGAERAEIAKAVESFGAAGPRISNRGLEGEMVRVDPAE